MLSSLRGLRLGWAIVALALGWPGRAAAQSIEEARERWFEADFEAARSGFRATLRDPALTRAHAVDAHRYLAALELILGDEASAREHADAAIALDAGVAPPEGSPPSVVDLFRMARRRADAREAHLVLSTSLPPTLSAPTLVLANLRSAPPSLVHHLRLRCGEEEASGRPPEVQLEVVPEGELQCTASAMTREGAVLFEERELFAVEGRSRNVVPWVVASASVAGAVVLAVVAVVLARRPGDAQLAGTTVVGW